MKIKSLREERQREAKRKRDQIRGELEHRARSLGWEVEKISWRNQIAGRREGSKEGGRERVSIRKEVWLE